MPTNPQTIVNSLWRNGDYWDQSTITYSIPASSPDDTFFLSNESDGFQQISTARRGSRLKPSSCGTT
jgi:hypothetical protein